LEEQKLSAVLEGGVRIDGKLDRIDPQDKTSLAIIDYKTGKPLTSFAPRSGKAAIKAWRHKTQLIFYALLAQKTPRFSQYPSVTGQMVYLEAETVRELTKEYTPSPEEIARMAALTTSVWKKIMACDFPDITQYEDSLEGIIQFEEDLLAGNI
jgi:RecB family exonuclease